MSKYHRKIKGVTVDYYNLMDAFGVTCSACAHAIKKLLLPGQRHAKGKLQDLQEAYASVGRAIELERERQAEQQQEERVSPTPIILGALALIASIFLLNTKIKHQ